MSEKLKDYLSGHEIYLDDYQIDTIKSICLKEEAHKQNVGLYFNRTKSNPRELAFYEQWMKENEPISGFNHGHGALQDIFIHDDFPFSVVSSSKIINEVMSKRDRMIVATVIQWLGSNCGMAFLSETFQRFGGKIKY